jgi:nucleotide-binding universal stress UspA family protein
MKTILIPVDFSLSANHAVDYAVDLSNNRDVEQLILFAQFHVSFFEQLYPTPDFIQAGEQEIQELKQQLTLQLEELKTKLLSKLTSGTTVKVVLLEMPLLRAVLKMIEAEKPDVLFLGSNNKETRDSSFIGSLMVEIAKVSTVPVFIVPPDTIYQPIKDVLVACDFRTINHVSLLSRLHKIKHWPHPKLTLLNVDPQQKHLHPDHPAFEINGIIKEVLSDYEYELFYSDDSDVLRGVVTFANQHDQQLIIALPGVHSFLYSLTHKSITEGLSRDANRPVLILK